MSKAAGGSHRLKMGTKVFAKSLWRLLALVRRGVYKNRRRGGMTNVAKPSPTDAPAPTLDATSTTTAPDSRDTNQIVTVMLKEYELALTRFDRTDERIIQLVGAGLAFFAAVILVIKDAPKDTPEGATVPSPPGIALWGCILFIALYWLLWLTAKSLYKRDLRRRKWTGTGSKAGAPLFRIALLFAATGVLFILGAEGVLQSVLVWVISMLPAVFGVAQSSPGTSLSFNLPLQLLWLAPLTVLAFHALVIYVMYSSFGLLWFCRVVSLRTNKILKEKVLIRFDHELPPGRFFSFTKGHPKPEIAYWLLLGINSILFLLVTYVSFVPIYADVWFGGILFLVLYLFLEYIEAVALSGMVYDLHDSHISFLTDIKDKIYLDTDYAYKEEGQGFSKGP